MMPKERTQGWEKRFGLFVSPPHVQVKDLYLSPPIYPNKFIYSPTSVQINLFFLVLKKLFSLQKPVQKVFCPNLHSVCLLVSFSQPTVFFSHNKPAPISPNQPRNQSANMPLVLCPKMSKDLTILLEFVWPTFMMKHGSAAKLIWSATQ